MNSIATAAGTGHADGSVGGKCVLRAQRKNGTWGLSDCVFQHPKCHFFLSLQGPKCHFSAPQVPFFFGFELSLFGQ